MALIWSFSSGDSIIEVMSSHVIFVTSSSDSSDRLKLWTIRLPTPSSISMSHTCGAMSVLSLWLVEGSGFAGRSGVYTASPSDSTMLASGRTNNVGSDDLYSRSVVWVNGGDAGLNSNSSPHGSRILDTGDLYRFIEVIFDPHGFGSITYPI